MPVLNRTFNINYPLRLREYCERGDGKYVNDRRWVVKATNAS